MTFRLVRYALAAMQRHLDNNNKAPPLGIPVLFYHGKISPYRYSMNWLGAFNDGEWARQHYCCGFPQVDVTSISDDEIMRHRRIAALELVQKHIRQRDMAELEPLLVMLLQLDYTTSEQLEALFNHMLQVGDTANPDAFISSLALRLPQHEDILMTIAQKLEEKARKAERLETKLEIARNMLKNGMDRIMVMTMTGLTKDDLKHIRH